MATTREIKHALIALLREPTPNPLEDFLSRVPLKKAVSPLVGFFCHRDEEIRLRAITALGMIIDRLAHANMEEARVVMRRLMWTLNDESGGIGWGAPEAMGDACARNEKIASEYHRILCSYVNEEGIFLEHETLQRGALWGLCRLAETDPEKVMAATSDVRKHLDSPDPVKQGLALIFAKRVGDAEARRKAKELTHSQHAFTLLSNWELKKTTVGQEAKHIA